MKGYWTELQYTYRSFAGNFALIRVHRLGDIQTSTFFHKKARHNVGIHIHIYLDKIDYCDNSKLEHLLVETMAPKKERVYTVYTNVDNYLGEQSSPVD